MNEHIDWVKMKGMENTIAKQAVGLSLLEFVEKYPATEKVFKKYDGQAGKCILCHHLFDSLEDVIEEYRLDRDKILADLESAIKQSRFHG